MALFGKNFFSNLFKKKSKNKTGADGLDVESLIKTELGDDQSIYDNTVLDDYYNKLNKEERRLNKGKMITMSSPLSERYVIGGDIGQPTRDKAGNKRTYTNAEGKRKYYPNDTTSGFTGVYNKQQLEDTGNEVGDEDVETAEIPSTAIAKMRYNPKTKNMYVTFTSSDKEYLYPKVPAEVARKFLNAESKGKFANKRLRKYRVSAPEAMQLASKYRGK